MTESDVRNYSDLLTVLNQYPFEAILEIDSTEIDCACRIASIELSPLDDKIDRLELELIHIDNMNPLHFTPETRLLITAKMMTAWSVRDEAQCQVTGVLDAIQEETGFRGTLYEWIDYNEDSQNGQSRLNTALILADWDDLNNDLDILDELEAHNA